MAQKAPVNENTSSSRPKYGLQHYKTLSGISDDLAPPEKLERLHALFKTLAAGTHAISDNLQPGELQRRLVGADGRGVTPTHMEMLLDENRHAIDLLRDCMHEMSLCPDKTRANILSECETIYQSESARLKAGVREYNALFGDKPVSVKKDDRRGFRPALTGIVLHALPVFMVIEDLIAA